MAFLAAKAPEKNLISVPSSLLKTYYILREMVASHTSVRQRRLLGSAVMPDLELSLMSRQRSASSQLEK